MRRRPAPAPGRAELLAIALALAGCSAGPGTLGSGGVQTLEPERTAVGAESGRLDRVTDGDTVRVVLDDGSLGKVRLLGIDSPEVRENLECGGDEATRALEGLFGPGDAVELLTDPTQDSVDRFGRLLRYVEVDGIDVGERQVAEGHATVYVFDRPFVRLDRYAEAEDDAREGRRGTWGRC